jgi:Fe-S-cluster-containing hydrogenase component 2
MLVPGVEVPHLCAQCDDYPCVESCPVSALSVDGKTSAVIVDREKCTGCSLCIEACPGQIPFLHPEDGKAVICDLCDGEPECVEVCQSARFDALIKAIEPMSISRKLFAITPEEMTKDLAVNIYGERGEELI